MPSLVHGLREAEGDGGKPRHMMLFKCPFSTSHHIKPESRIKVGLWETPSLRLGERE